MTTDNNNSNMDSQSRRTFMRQAGRIILSATVVGGAWGLPKEAFACGEGNSDSNCK